MPIGVMATAGLASTGISAVGNYFGQKAQAGATQNANQTLWNMFGVNQQTLAPFINAGTGALTKLQNLTGTNAGGNPLTAPLTAPFQPTMDQLAQTPGYQFTLQQGLLGTQNSFAAKGLGSSGPALKGAADYASGLAANTYEQQFQNYWNQNQNIYNMLTGQVNTGANAAYNAVGMGTNIASGVAGNLTNLGNATAGAITNTANTAGSSLTNIAGLNLLQSLLQGSGGAGGGAIPPSIASQYNLGGVGSDVSMQDLLDSITATQGP